MKRNFPYVGLLLVVFIALLPVSGASSDESVKNASPIPESNSPSSEFFQLSFPISSKPFKWYAFRSDMQRYTDYTSIIDHIPPYYYGYSTELEPHTGEHGPTTGTTSDACGRLNPSQRPYCYNGHSGLDIPVTLNTNVYASHAGFAYLVNNCGENCAYGNYIRIRDEQNPAFVTLYAHLNQTLIDEGTHVARGELIGTVDCSGYGCGGTAYHLHWGLYYDPAGNTIDQPDAQGSVLDPYGWFSLKPNPIASPIPVPTDYKWAKGYSSQGFQNELPTFDLNEGTLQGHEYINRNLQSNGVYETGAPYVDSIEAWWANTYGAAGPPRGARYWNPSYYGYCQEFEGGTYCPNGYAPFRFTDVPLTHWAHRYIEWATRENIISGYDDGTFRPQNFVTRAQFSKMAVESFQFPIGPPPVPIFCDVPAGYWAFSYIMTLEDLGIISGYDAGSDQCQAACQNNSDRCFLPGGNITRGQLSKMVAESARNKWNISIYSAIRGPDYWDVPADPDEAYYNYIRTLYDIGAIRYRRADGDAGCQYGSDCQDLGHFFVGWSATRAQVTQLLHETFYSMYCPPPNSCPR